MLYNRAELEKDLEKCDALDAEICRGVADGLMDGFTAREMFNDVEKMRASYRFKLVRVGMGVGDILHAKRDMQEASNAISNGVPGAAITGELAAERFKAALSNVRTLSIGPAPATLGEEEENLCTDAERAYLDKAMPNRVTRPKAI
jgi:hypothetical protein